ncbi:MAG: putative esterase [Actinomycetia bacterium]|nr:putative esterase [Actinomycetes bacterium]
MTMPASSHRRRGLRRIGAVLAAAALGATLAPVVTAEAATFKPADDGAKITAYKWLNAQEFDFTVKSPALGSSQNVRVLVPKTWRWTSHATWPVLYVFHGGHDTYTSWTRNTNIATTAKAWNAMVVMPEGANGSYTDWFNYGKGGSPKWETFHTQEVRQLIERNYHGGGIRAAMGNSSGGEGSITYAERHPGLFKYAASFSGPLSLRSPGVPAMLMYTDANLGVDPYRIWGNPWAPSGSADAANWTAHDPWALAGRLKGTGTGIFFSSGTSGKPGPGDPNVAPWDIGLLSEVAVGTTNVAFRDQMQKLGIPFTSDIYGNGRHAWPAWRREYLKLWPTLMKSIGAKKF